MYPVLFSVFGVEVPSYAALMVLGYLLALAILLYGLRETSKDKKWHAFDLYRLCVVMSLIGSKVGHTLFEAPGHFDEDGQPINSLGELLRADPWHWARVLEAGHVWYGGLIVALLAGVVFFKRRPELSFWDYADYFAPPVMFGAFVGRIGCFLAGCCHGRPTDSFLGVQFPQLPGPVHPTQLYDSLSGLGIGVVLLMLVPRRKFDGQVLSLLLIVYPIFRFSTEAFRGDAERGYWGPLSTSQAISLVIFAAGVWLYLYAQNRVTLELSDRERSAA